MRQMQRPGASRVCRRNAVLTGAACAAALVIAAGHAVGQNALGDGTGLDNNLLQGSGGRNAAARDFAAEVRFRNAIVTGNAPGGRSFRGDVGYGSAFDFRGELGEDDIFAFNRDSFYSSLATRNIGNIESVQTTLAQSVGGQTFGSGLGGPIIVTRDVAPTAGEVTNPVRFGSVRVDSFGAIRGVLRSPGRYEVESARTPQPLARVEVDERTGVPTVVTASSLLGIKELPTTNGIFGSAIEIEGITPPPDGSRATWPPAETSDQDDARITDRVEPIPAGAARLEAEQLSRPVRSAIDDVRSELRDRIRTEPAPDAGADDDAPPGAEPAEPIDAIEPTAAPSPLDALRDLLTGSRPAAGDDEEPADRPTLDVLTETERLSQALLRGEPMVIDSLEPTLTTRGLYAAHMKRGEELLRERRWFSAEERFTAALGLVPGDPMAAAGRVHAQLAAGMFRSAAVNLKQTLRGYPELIATRFEPTLLPHGDRLEVVIEQLRERMSTAAPIAPNAALLLAYLGFQTGDGDAVRDGLDRHSELTAAAQPDPLITALRIAWRGRGG